jgi:protein SCO1/2
MAAREMNKLNILALAGALLLAACAATPTEPPPLQGATMGGAFSLVDQNNRRVTDRDFAGKYRLVYFGFSFCPDVCPVDLAALAKGLTAFERDDAARAARVVPIFITVGSRTGHARRTQEVRLCVSPAAGRVTGTEAEIAATAKRYAVAFSKRPGVSAGAYTMDHSRMAVLYGPDGAPIAIIPHDEGPAAAAKALDQWVA